MDANNSYDEMFYGNDIPEENQETIIPTESLVAFYDHIFPPYQETAMLELMKSIEDNGLWESLLVRKHPIEDGKYEILSGHNRAEACRRLKMENISVKIISKDMTDNAARLIVIDTNLKHRSLNELKLSQRARIVGEWYKLIKAQGTRKDLEKEVDEANIKAKDKEDEPFSLGSAQISRYVRINEKLIDDLKECLDDGKLSIIAGYEISYLEDDEQDVVCEAINSGAKISTSKATEIKKKGKEIKITKEVLDEMLVKKKKEEDDKKLSVKLSDQLIEKFFKDVPETEIKEILELALESYFKA
ncbi:ParB/RepB/Spo0J family partition protein [Acetobacterium sp.]|uniref:ParB/RepB/Spo0J family partition protein n=1 Tax=Acetobacterium sp. TaxID=1872094 RepID=UPI002F42E031